MKTGSKAVIVTLALATIVGGGIYLNQTDSELFKGLIVKDQPVDPEQAQRERELGLKADLKAGIEVLPSEEGSDDVKVRATIENVGDGSILGNIPFIYKISINGTDVFSNQDSYTYMDPGDAFSFDYPISKGVYQYPDNGVVTFEIDTENSIDEDDEDNNKAKAAY